MTAREDVSGQYFSSWRCKHTNKQKTEQNCIASTEKQKLNTLFAYKINCSDFVSQKLVWLTVFYAYLFYYVGEEYKLRKH